MLQVRVIINQSKVLFYCYHLPINSVVSYEKCVLTVTVLSNYNPVSFLFSKTNVFNIRPMKSVLSLHFRVILNQSYPVKSVFPLLQVQVIIPQSKVCSHCDRFGLLSINYYSTNQLCLFNYSTIKSVFQCYRSE